MAELVEYPSILPLPQLAGHSIENKGGVLRTKMDSGHTRRRRRFKNVPRKMPVKWLFSSDELAVFESWYEESISGGADVFLMSVKLPVGVKSVNAAIDGGYKASPKSQNVWLVTANLELTRVPLMDPELSGAVVGLGYLLGDLNGLLPRLEDAVNNNELSD